MMGEKTYRKCIVTPSIMSIWNTRRKPSQRSNKHFRSNNRANKKSPAKRQIERITGPLLPAAGVEPAQCRRVYVRIAKSCRITFQTNKKKSLTGLYSRKARL